MAKNSFLAEVTFKDQSYSLILPVSIKPAISVSNFCISPTLSNYNDAMVLKKAVLILTHLRFSPFTNSALQSSFCRSKFLSPKILLLLNLLSQFLQQIAIYNFSCSILSVIKSNDSKPACCATSNMSSFTSSTKAWQMP